MSMELQEKRGSDSDVQYALSSVVMHHGSRATGGHYTTYIARQTANQQSIGDVHQGALSTEWWHCNDGIVQAATEVEVLQAAQEAYLLFYTAVVDR
jgi:ubiquitin C-terminal hydrolase